MPSAAALTLTRPAGAALERHFSVEVGEPSVATAQLDALAVQQAQLSLRITRLVSGMDDAARSTAELDAMTEEIAQLLARAEQLRVDRARAATMPRVARRESEAGDRYAVTASRFRADASGM